MLIFDFFTYEFLRYALYATLLLALASGPLAPLVVAKGHAFMGAAISHSTLLGVALGLVIAQSFGTFSEMALYFSTFVFTLLMVLALAGPTLKKEVPSDSLIGIFLALSMSLAVIVHQLFVSEVSDLMGYLFGQIILISQLDLMITFFVTVLIIVFILGNIKRWQALIFDPQGAILLGLSVKKYHYLFYTLLTLFVVVGVKISGSILINSLLLAPGIFALRFSKSLRQAIFLSTLFSVITCLAGLFIAGAFNLPPGSTMALCQCLVLLLLWPLNKK